MLTYIHGERRQEGHVMLLLIDSYDSFTYNLRSLVEEATGEHVVVVHNDQLTPKELTECLGLFTGVVVGPGPGHPANAEDVGVIPALFEGFEEVPVLGICLGFQSLCLSQGCEVARIKDVKHGQVYKVDHNGDALFKDIDQGFDSVRYHSLCVPHINDSLRELAFTSETDGSNVLMAVKHTSNPWYGVQYHPESICSSFGKQLVSNFHEIAQRFNDIHRDIITDEQILSKLMSKLKVEPLVPNSRAPYALHKESIASISTIQLCDTLHNKKHEFILLNSASSPGNWSIVGLPSAASLRVTHSTESNNIVKLRQNGREWTQEIDSIWSFISETISSRLMEPQSEFPFVGGFLGLFSYEEGHHIHLQNLPQFTKTDIPDTKLVFVEECILINNSTGETFITSLNSVDRIDEIKSLVTQSSSEVSYIKSINPQYVEKPDKQQYVDNFNKCQQFLHSGDSYELCLTVPTSIGISKQLDPWEIYKLLTKKNPSPYSAFFDFDDCVLLSSSPERFLAWDNDTCELRPIKGTVKKTPEMDFAKASNILHTPKELGENLMIVDLIRHDLYQLLNRVDVSKLMSVEEYSTVYQLVSVITGYFEATGYSGIDVLSQSLPPGSMTGAPKKRSVEILQELETLRRGLYSGICGYWSVENKGDWSVIIRSIFHYKDDLKNTEQVNLWRIGAGGAITVLSDCEGEWEEMLTKLDSALRTFE